MRVFEAEASGNKASILRKTLVLSILQLQACHILTSGIGYT